MKNVLFLVHTEFHMMVSLSLIADHFSDENHVVRIIQTIKPNSKRFQFDQNTNLSKNIRISAIEYDNDLITRNAGLKQTIDQILTQHCDVFVFFNQHVHLSVFLAKELNKKGTKILLAPDGLKPYSTTKRHTPRWSLKFAFRFIKFLLIYRLPFHWYFPTLNYGKLSSVSSVFLRFPDSYMNLSKKKLRKFDLLNSQKSRDLSHQYFNFNIESELQESQRKVFYLNQPFRNKEINDFEIELLNYLRQSFRDYELIIKLHPETEATQISRFKEIDDLRLISKSYPAELYIIELSDSIVLSFWSTANLIRNNKIRSYWLYPLLVNENKMLDYVKIINPSNNITEINHLEEIV